MKPFELFQDWCIRKWELIQQDRQFFVHEGEIWMSYLGMNIGSEQDGGRGFVRPVLIVKLCSPYLFIALPLTSKQGKRKDCRLPLENIDFLNETSFVMLDQVRTIDKRRLYRKLGTLSSKLYREILQKSKEFTYVNSFSEPNKGQQ